MSCHRQYPLYHYFRKVTSIQGLDKDSTSLDSIRFAMGRQRYSTLSLSLSLSHTSSSSFSSSYIVYHSTNPQPTISITVSSCLRPSDRSSDCSSDYQINSWAMLVDVGVLMLVYWCWCVDVGVLVLILSCCLLIHTLWTDNKDTVLKDIIMTELSREREWYLPTNRVYITQYNTKLQNTIEYHFKIHCLE